MTKARAARLSYLELPVDTVTPTCSFYEQAFDWRFAAFGPSYSATESGDTDIGINADPDDRTGGLLPVIDVGNLEETLRKVIAAGGIITRTIFAFPGGSRFHFRDPAGHELAAVTLDVPDAATP